MSTNKIFCIAISIFDNINFEKFSMHLSFFAWPLLYQHSLLPYLFPPFLRFASSTSNSPTATNVSDSPPARRVLTLIGSRRYVETWEWYPSYLLHRGYSIDCMSMLFFSSEVLDCSSSRRSSTLTITSPWRRAKNFTERLPHAPTKEMRGKQSPPTLLISPCNDHSSYFKLNLFYTLTLFLCRDLDFDVHLDFRGELSEMNEDIKYKMH